MKTIRYNYKNLPIPGGGYVTGFLFHPKKEKTLYIRTDIGGCYRFDYAGKRWHSLTESVNMFDLSETYPAAIAAAPEDPESLYVISGIYDHAHGKFSISRDGGKTFVHKEMPCYVHGNLNGRGTGYRLICHPYRENILYYASQRDGLLRTEDGGETWTKLQTGRERHMTFVWCSPDGRTLIAGTAGIDTGNSKMRGHSLYVSYDAGTTFEKMPMPEAVVLPDSRWSGLVAARYDYDGTYFYCTLSQTGKNSYVKELGYSCDSGDLLGGRVLRYSFDGEGRISGYEDITPKLTADETGVHETDLMKELTFGFGGISCCPAMPGLLALCTLCREEGDMLYISRDCGDTWEVALFDLSIGNLHFEAPYMKPEYNGGHSLLHWLSDVKINPFNPDEVWFNSGTGVFAGTDFTKDTRSFADCCSGIEETVHLNVYSPPDGPVQVLDILGDLGGFAFTDIDRPCENSFADGQGNRYITCINADFSDLHPQNVAVTPRGNWKGKTKGGLILSRDYGLSFRRPALPYGISDYLDERFRQIECPNVNSGWVALNSSADSLVYCVAEGIDLFMKGIVYSNDFGNTFGKTRIYDRTGQELSESREHMKVFSDRVNPEIFYGFGDGLRLFISRDRGRSFYELDRPAENRTINGAEQRGDGEEDGFAGLCLGLIDCANKTEIRGEAGKEGVFYCALGKCGLWKLCFDFAAGAVCMNRLTGKGDPVYRVGLGILREGGDYLREEKALYICGRIHGIYGFFRSFDEGVSFERINTDEKQFGDINSIDGDSRHFGRFYIATGSFGLKVGEPAE